MLIIITFVMRKFQMFKFGNIWKNRSHFEKWVRHGKMTYTWKNVSHLKKCVTVGKMGHA